MPYEKIRLIIKRKTYDEWGELFIKLIKEDSTNHFYRTKYNDDDADIIAIPTGDLKDFIIQPVDIPKTNTLKKGDMVFIVGFPEVADERHFQLAQFGKIIPNPNLNSSYLRFKGYPVEFVNRRTSAGFSGSPVYLWPNSTQTPVLAGINAAVDIENDISIIWRVEVLNNLLSSIK